MGELTASPEEFGERRLPASPTAPHMSAAASGGASAAGAVHWTHALALHATLPPLGSAAGKLDPAAVM